MTEPQEIYPQNVELHEPDDIPYWRKKIYEDAVTSFQSAFPKVYGNVRLEVEDLDYQDPEEFSLEEEQKALMEDRPLMRRLRGKLTLYDNDTNEKLDSTRKVLMRVPYLSQRGTFIHNGTDYSPIRQARLLPGVYTRRKKNSEIETQFNTKTGTGVGFRIGFDPRTAVFKMNIDQANLRLYSLLHDLGVPDEQMRKTWGDDIFEINKKAYDPRVFDKAYSKFMGRFAEQDLSRSEKINLLREKIGMGRVSKSVLKRTLPEYFENV